MWLLCRVEDHEHAPTDEPQDCIKCHRHLPARWFYLRPRRSRGRDSVCLACYAKKTCPDSRKQRQTPQQKRCGRCQRVLEAACFNRRSRITGSLQSICRECQGIIGKDRKTPLIQVAVQSKRCQQCKVDKPAAAFDIAQRFVDGLHAECKDCKRARNREQWQRQQQQQQQ